MASKTRKAETADAGEFVEIPHRKRAGRPSTPSPLIDVVRELFNRFVDDQEDVGTSEVAYAVTLADDKAVAAWRRQARRAVEQALTEDQQVTVRLRTVATPLGGTSGIHVVSWFQAGKAVE